MLNRLKGKKNKDQEKTGSSVDSGFAEGSSSSSKGSSSSSSSSTSLPKLGTDEKQATLTKTRHGSTSTLSSTTSSVKDLDETDAIEERVNTFLNQGWDGLISLHGLAEAGFQYAGTDDVACILCGVQISGWKTGDIPLKRHIKESPKCTFAKYKRKQSKKKRKSNIQFDSPKRSENEDSSDEYEDDEMEMYSSEFNRLVTFKEWPLSSPVDRYDLAAAGFYRVLPSTVVQCYACDVKVEVWNLGDRPKKKHEQLNPKCPHVMGKETSGNKPLHSSEKRQAVNISIRNN